MKQSTYFFLCLILCFVTTTATAASPVFKIEKNNSVSYLVGTVHLLKQSDHPLPKQINHAFDQSSTIVFETDIEQMNLPEFQNKMIQALTFNDGSNIENHLKPATYSRLNAHLQKSGMPIAQLQQFTPAGLSIMLVVMESMKQGHMPHLGVEQTYLTKAKQEKKKIASLESLETQLSFLVNMGNGKEDEMVLSTISQLSEFETMMANIKTHWLDGNLDAMDKLGNASMRDEFPHAYNTLIVERNNNWLPIIKKMNSNQEVEVIMVGALHLAGPDGLVAKLRRDGYKITNL